MKRLRSALSAFAAAAALVVGGFVSVAPANATSYVSFDVTRLSARDLVVKDWQCQNTTVRMSHSEHNAYSWWVDTSVTHDNSHVSSALFSDSGNGSRDEAQVCPSLHGLGKYRVGPSDVSAHSYGYDDSLYDTDYTMGTFYVRALAKTQISAKRSGKKVKLTVKAQRYNPDTYKYSRYNPKATIQVKSGKKWKKVATVQLRNGSATKTVKTSSKRTYRVTFSKVSWATGATSGTVKR